MALALGLSACEPAVRANRAGSPAVPAQPETIPVERTGPGDSPSARDDAAAHEALLGDDEPFGRYGTVRRVPEDLRPEVSVRLGAAIVVGDLDKNIIRRYIRRNLLRIKDCYEKGVLARPGLAGTVVAEFTIAPTGRVKRSEASGVSDYVDRCVADAIQSIEFPKPRGASFVEVRYPFTFRVDRDPPRDQKGARRAPTRPGS